MRSNWGSPRAELTRSAVVDRCGSRICSASNCSLRRNQPAHDQELGRPKIVVLQVIEKRAAATGEHTDHLIAERKPTLQHHSDVVAGCGPKGECNAVGWLLLDLRDDRGHDKHPNTHLKQPRKPRQSAVTTEHRHCTHRSKRNVRDAGDDDDCAPDESVPGEDVS